MDGIIGGIDVVVRELSLFAAAGLLIGGLDDLLVDLFYLVRRLGRGRTPPIRSDALPCPTPVSYTHLTLPTIYSV